MRTLLLIFALALSGCAAPYRYARSREVDRTYVGRQDGMVRQIVFSDTERGGGWFLLVDPKTQAVSAYHTNRLAIHIFNLGESSMVVDPQTSEIVKATGAAVGAVLGTALKTAVGKP